MITIRTSAMLVLLAVPLAACVDVTDPEGLKDMQTNDLCESYYFSTHKPAVPSRMSWPEKQAQIKKELDGRRAVTPGEWLLIDQGRIQAGMSECALRAAWGYPQHINHAVTAAGDQYYFYYTSSRHADVTNGRVVSFQY